VSQITQGPSAPTKYVSTSANPRPVAAPFQLATEIPAAILARTLGIHTDVAVAWQRLSAGIWANYAAGVSRRTSPQQQPVHEQGAKS
jgi:hypothetical protein